jgi:Zn-dependent M28 family amino/carboxypeptidase
VTLARLFRTSTYPKYKYRVRFCWWGAEEVGLLGSDYHVKQAKTSSVAGERLSDYLINLNYDMLGTPNYIFGKIGLLNKTYRGTIQTLVVEVIMVHF